MAVDSSVSSDGSHGPCAISLTAFSVPARQGVHWPQTLVLEELHQVERDRLHIVLVGQDDNRVGTDEAAEFFQGSEIHRLVRHRRGQDAAGGAARQIALEGVAVGHAAAEFLDQFARGDAGRREHHARLLDAAGDREAAEAFALLAALAASSRPRPSRRCRGSRTASRRSAPASGGRTGRPARHKAGGGAAARACLRSIRSSRILRRRCRRRRRGADAAWCAATDRPLRPCRIPRRSISRSSGYSSRM